jgi:hypothetical protein
LVQVHTDPPDQSGRPDQLGQRLAQRCIRRIDHASSRGQGRLSRVRALGQTGVRGGDVDLAVLLLGQSEPDTAQARRSLAGPPP